MGQGLKLEGYGILCLRVERLPAEGFFFSASKARYVGVATCRISWRGLFNRNYSHPFYVGPRAIKP